MPAVLQKGLLSIAPPVSKTPGGGPRCIYTSRPADMRMDACKLLTLFSALRSLGGQFALVYRPLAQRANFFGGSMFP